MSSQSLSPSDSADAVLPAAPSAAEDIAVLSRELDADAFELLADHGSGGPPADLLAQIAAADAIHRELRHSGRELRFARDQHHDLRIELHDHTAATVTRLSATQAVEFASGGGE